MAAPTPPAGDRPDDLTMGEGRSTLLLRVTSGARISATLVVRTLADEDVSSSVLQSEDLSRCRAAHHHGTS